LAHAWHTARERSYNLSIQAGDRIFVPLEVQRTGWETFQVVAASAGAFGSLAVLVSLFF
jgi:hypothetical protein